MATKRTQTRKTKQQSNGGGRGRKIANISELHRKTGLDRATVVKRLKNAGVEPKQVATKKTEFDETEAIKVLAKAEPDSAGYNKARTNKTNVAAARELLKLQKERGELVPISEMKEHAYQFVKAMHGRFMRYARESKGRLHKNKTADDLERSMTADFAQIFGDLKRDYPRIF